MSNFVHTEVVVSMVLHPYRCERCGYCTVDLSRFKRHNDRKHPCSAAKNVAAFHCTHCHKRFATKRTLHAHLESASTPCPSRAPAPAPLEPFGAANIQKRDIGQALLDKLKHNPLEHLDEVVRVVHFDAHHPELHNVYVPNRNRDVAHVWDGTRWRAETKHFLTRRLLASVYKFMQLRDDVPVPESLTGLCVGFPTGLLFRRTRDTLWRVILQEQHVMLDAARASERRATRLMSIEAACIKCCPGAPQPHGDGDRR
jgi:hypothetical protein